MTYVDIYFICRFQASKFHHYCLKVAFFINSTGSSHFNIVFRRYERKKWHNAHRCKYLSCSNIFGVFVSVLSQMTEVPDNRMSQIAEFEQTEEVYNIAVFLEFLSIVIHQVSTFEYTVYNCLIHYFNIKFWSIKKIPLYCKLPQIV